MNPPLWFALARAVHFAACLLLLGVCVFDRFIARGFDAPWRSVARWLIAAALPLALASGVFWFAGVAVEMSGLTLTDAMHGDVLGTVWERTSFGRLWEFRLALWPIAAATMGLSFLPARPPAAMKWLTLLVCAVLVASLDWAGHGQYGKPAEWHLVSDAAHLLVAGCWPSGLLPFALLLRKLRRGEPADVLRLTVRFSWLSQGAVTLLMVSGAINGWFMLGSFHNLVWTNYGRLLMVKIAAFGVMIAFGANNLFKLKPRLLEDRRAAVRLQRNVALELILALAVLVIIGFLGLMEPAPP